MMEIVCIKHAHVSFPRCLAPTPMKPLERKPISSRMGQYCRYDEICTSPRLFACTTGLGLGPFQIARLPTPALSNSQFSIAFQCVQPFTRSIYVTSATCHMMVVKISKIVQRKLACDGATWKCIHLASFSYLTLLHHTWILRWNLLCVAFSPFAAKYSSPSEATVCWGWIVSRATHD